MLTNDATSENCKKEKYLSGFATMQSKFGLLKLCASYLFADGIPNHTIKIWCSIASCVKELPP